ncbi:MAG: V-type ATPase subunit [Oscillospiraceae bacterium]|nr:V-type ATPase subunit [Oscillospiraceae bacterium]
MIDYSYNATVAKARTFYGKRLKEDDYRELLKKTTIPEIAEYLKRNTHFSECLSNIDTASVHRGYLEDILNRETFNEYVRLCNFQKLNEISFFNYRYINNEITVILRCIIYINAGTSEKFIDTISPYLAKHASFDMMKLGEVRTYNDLLDILKKTPYYSIIKDQKPDDNGNYNCTEIDILLKTYYVNWVKEAIKRDFSGSVQKDMLEITGILYDLSNVYNAFRYKAFSGADYEEISHILFPVPSNITKFRFYELMNTNTAEEYIDVLKNTGYGRRMVAENSEISRASINHDIEILRNRFAKNYLRKSTNAAVSIYTILFLLTTEVKNIITIIEGIRYGVPVQSIEEMLVIV